jgi:hypothetical protein
MFEKKDREEEFLKSRNTSIKQLKEQYKGRKFGELILYHIGNQNLEKTEDVICGLKGRVHPVLIIPTDNFLDTVVYCFAMTKEFWRLDCGEALILYVNATKSEAKKYNIEVTDDYAFDIFNLIVFCLVKRAITDLDFEKFIRKSIKRFWIF